MVGELPPADDGSAAGKAGTAGDSGNLPPVAGAPNDPACDADRDGHQAEGKCGGDDCDDSDADVFTQQPKYFSARQDNVGYDYDCNGKPQQEQPAPVVCMGIDLTACPTGEGFLRTLPACGVIGKWGKCVKGTLTCDEQVIDDMRPMRCH